MYCPKIFELENENELFEFIEQWSFGDLVTTCDGELFINHLPFLERSKRFPTNAIPAGLIAPTKESWGAETVVPAILFDFAP